MAEALLTCGCGASMAIYERNVVSFAYRCDEFHKAHAGCRPIPPGPCMARLDAFRGEGPVACCSLLHGHQGGHRDGDTTWTDLPTESPMCASGSQNADRSEPNI